MLGILVSAVGAGIAAYYWRDTIRDYIAQQGPRLSARAADALGELGDRACGALGTTRSRVDAAVRSGQEHLRSTRRSAEKPRQRGTGALDPQDVSEGKIMLP